MNIEEYTDSIQKKIGKEEAGKIADDIAKILTYENKIKKDIKDRDDEISKLKKDKEMLVEANGNLLQSIPMGKEKDEKKEEEENKPFDFRTVFDEKGNLKR